jgi:hypothetical protein
MSESSDDYKTTHEYDNSGSGPLKVPGFGLAMDHEASSGEPPHFRHGANDFLNDRLTAREIAMLRLMDSITDKQEWNTKVYNDEILASWLKEAASASNGLINERTFDWCMEELRDKAKMFEACGGAWTTAYDCGSGVAKADNIILEDLHAELRKEVQPLLDAEPKDWHPNSNGQVLNLVHPSLYPLVYGRTPVLVNGGTVSFPDCSADLSQCEAGEDEQVVPPNPRAGSHGERYPGSLYSENFQWLPAEVKFQGDSGTDVKFTSYINNLHPRDHPNLYKVIEQFISKAIPLWNDILVRRDGRLGLRIYTTKAEVELPEQPEWARQYPESDEEWEVFRQNLREYMDLPENPSPWGDEEIDEDLEGWDETGSDFDEDVAWRAMEWKTKRMRKVVHPELGSYAKWKAKNHDDDDDFRLEKEYRLEGLQIIVKLSSIELTPDKPSYAGGSWHLEGMLSEHIIGTAIYYYDVDNVTTSRLRFRHEASLDEEMLEYEQNDHGPLAEVFGVDSATNGMWDVPAVQVLGGVKTPQGRLVAFPNTLQHRVDPFELVDKMRPGHRRFLVLWLVDPNIRIVSTANVPPQQRKWWVRNAMTAGWNRQLPPELTEMVLKDAVEPLMSEEEAKAYRLELMEERTDFARTVDSGFESYNLCEH